MLAIVTCHFNPTGYDRPLKNFGIFRRSLGVPGQRWLFGHQAIFDDNPRVEGLAVIPAGPEHIMWQKERLLKNTISRLPAVYDKVAWVDADLLFANPYWYEQTEEILDKLPVCQLMETVHDVDRYGRTCRTSHTAGWYRNKEEADPSQWYRTGGAWAARREIAETCLYDWDIIGGGDAATYFAWTGEYGRWINKRSRLPLWQHQYRGWANEQYEMVGGRIGVVPGDCIHLWHGDKKHRQYQERIAVLEQHQVNPFVDLEIDSNGLWKWATDKPKLHAAVREYFIHRAEDG